MKTNLTEEQKDKWIVQLEDLVKKQEREIYELKGERDKWRNRYLNASVGKIK